MPSISMVGHPRSGSDSALPVGRSSSSPESCLTEDARLGLRMPRPPGPARDLEYGSGNGQLVSYLVPPRRPGASETMSRPRARVLAGFVVTASVLALGLSSAACGGSRGSDSEQRHVALRFAQAIARHDERAVLLLAPSIKSYYEDTFHRGSRFDRAGSKVSRCQSSAASPFSVASGPCYRVCIWGQPHKTTSGPNSLTFDLGSLLIIVPATRPIHVKDFAYLGSGEEGPAAKIRLAYKLALPPRQDCKPRQRY